MSPARAPKQTAQRASADRSARNRHRCSQFVMGVDLRLDGAVRRPAKIARRYWLHKTHVGFANPSQSPQPAVPAKDAWRGPATHSGPSSLGAATTTRTPARLSAAASRFGGAASDTSSIDVGERANALELDQVEFRAVDEQDRPVRPLHHRALDRAAERIRIGHAVGRHAARADERLVRLEPSDEIHRVRAEDAALRAAT